MNKKGFTLIELLAVVAIIAIIAVIAIPNIVKIANSSRNEQYLSDAKNMISKAKYMYRFADGKYSNKFVTEENCKIITLDNLSLDIEKTADGSIYDDENSKVKICVLENEIKYYVKTYSTLENGKIKGIGISSFVEEKNMTKDSVIEQ